MLSDAEDPELHLGTDAAGSGSAEGCSGQPDCAQRVFSMAPFWVYAHLWHMERHCNSSSGPPFTICFSCPLTSDEMLKLYRERQLKGSNLIVGLTPEVASKHGGTDIPPAFLRTLAYLFELVKKGLEYAPLTEEDVEAGAPPLTWAPPLWPTEPAVQPVSLEDPMQLFQAAPYWCYLYNHEPQRSKKTPPKTAAQMASMYMSGHLPLWAPVLGLESEVARFNSLPPCLFMTLGTVASLLAAGQCIKAVGIRELQRFDKFIGYRSATGSTNALPIITSQDSGSAHSSQQALRAASPSGPMVHTRDSSLQSSGSLFNHAVHPSMGNGTHAAPWQSSRAHGACNGDTSTSGFAMPSSPGVASIPRSNSDASGNWAASASQAYSHPFQQPTAAPPFQHRRGHSGNNATSVACVPAFSSSALAPLSPISSPASPANPLSVATVPPPIPWQTALFKLFTSDASRGRFQPLWWYLDLSSPTGMHGPISAEHMIIGYLQGTLGDTSMVCGTTSECTSGHRPSYDSFEPIGVLLEKINQGGHYVLVTLNELLGLPPSVQPATYPALPTYQPASAPPLPAYTYQPPVSSAITSAPLPTYTPTPLPAYATNGAYSPSPAPLPAITTSMPPSYEGTRMAHHQRGPSGSSGLVGMPPPHGLPPTHHPLSPRNLNILRNGHNRHKSHSASRTSLALTENSQLAALAAQHAHHSAQHGSSRDSNSSAGHSETHTTATPASCVHADTQHAAATQPQQPQGEAHHELPPHKHQQPAATATISLASGQKAIGSYTNDSHCSEGDSAGDHLRKGKPPALHCSNTNVEQSVMSLST